MQASLTPEPINSLSSILQHIRISWRANKKTQRSRLHTIAPPSMICGPQPSNYLGADWKFRFSGPDVDLLNQSAVNMVPRDLCTHLHSDYMLELLDKL